MIKKSLKKNINIDSSKVAKRTQSESHKLVQKGDGALTASSAKGKGVLATAPSLNNAAVIESFQANVMGKDADLGAMVEMLEISVKTISKDDLSGLEAMLVGQATALQTIFTSLSRRAAAQQQLPHFQTYMGLALKAQAQGRATITALGDLKHPRQASFFGQTNLTTGPQQVNNVIHAAPYQGTEQKPLNQLSEGSNELCQNTRTPSLEISPNQTLETLGKINRTKVDKRYGC